MSFSSKYTDCGCGQRTQGNANYGNTTCCGSPTYTTRQPNCGSNVQPSPEPCCESHEIRYVTAECFRPSANVVATDTTGGFPLTFKNSEDITPLNIDHVFFFHGAAGFMRIISTQGSYYLVELEDPTKAGALIAEDDCVHLTIKSSAGAFPPFASRCLAGYFTAPAVGAPAVDIAIVNGSGIPIGATLTFTAEGETGSYTVTQYVSASGNIVVYKVSNTGSGHAAGTIIDGGPTASCLVPIEVITDVDICDLSATQNADQFAACVSGSPRAFVSQGLDSVPVGDGTGKWIQKRISSADCCVITEGVLKFSGLTCPAGTDQVTLQNLNLTCFVEAFNLAASKNLNLPVKIGSTSLIVTAYNSGSRLATIALAPDSNVTPPIEFPAGTQICLGSCCNSCFNGPQVSSYQDGGPLVTNATINLESLSTLSFGSGTVTYWLLGINNTNGAQVLQALDSTYFADPESGALGLPRFSDPMVLRQKICNTSDKGCSQMAEVMFNYELNFGLLNATMIVDWELGHYSKPSATLQDNVTPNPFTDFSTRAKASGRVQGTTAYDNMLNNSSFANGGPGSGKMMPNFAGNIWDKIPLQKCNCALSILWFMFRITSTAAPGTPHLMDVRATIKRSIRKYDFNYIQQPPNYAASQGFN